MRTLQSMFFMWAVDNCHYKSSLFNSTPPIALYYWQGNTIEAVIKKCIEVKLAHRSKIQILVLKFNLVKTLFSVQFWVFTPKKRIFNFYGESFRAEKGFFDKFNFFENSLKYFMDNLTEVSWAKNTVFVGCTFAQ